MSGARVILGAFFATAALCFAARAETFSFRTHIVPVLSKAGCNAGACHGAASGQADFRLSLLGYDPEEDYWNITREFGGRRVDLDNPKESLLLRKASVQLEHEGGRKLPRGSDDYLTVLRWIEAGAPYGAEDLRITSINVDPADLLLPGIGEAAQLRVTASFSDGSRRDVTSLALFTSNDDGIASVDRAGRVLTRGRGLASVMVRFGGQVAASRIAVPFASEQPPTPFPARNFIDEEIGAELARLGIHPSDLSTDVEFARRVYLDLTGKLPELPVARDWSRRSVATDSSKDRQELIRTLLQSDAFVDFWTLKFADLLLISGKRGSEKATLAYHRWLREQIATNAPLHQLARALLVTSGDPTLVGPVNFLNLATDPRDLSEYASDILLGLQIGCARCHAHPSDRWTRDDYYEFAALFSRISREGGVIGRSQRGTIEYPKSRSPVRPRLLGGHEAVTGDGDPLALLADWIAHPDNPFFARTMVNRVWKHLLGRGLVEPVNDLRPTNPATHPRLLDRLAQEFISHHYDLRWLIETIANSRTYQLSSRVNESNAQDDRLYGRAYLKPLPAQVFLDAVSQVTGVPETFDGVAPSTHATQLIGSQVPSYALDVLGRCARERACEPGTAGGGLAQALHLINGSTINSKLQTGYLQEALTQSDHQLITEFYLRALARMPGPPELRFWEKVFADSANRIESAEDFLWTLLNSREFAYNH